jgi:hypothetical protein
LASFHWASLGGTSLHANTPGNNNSRHHRLQCTPSLGNTARQHLWPSSLPCHYSAPILPISGFKFAIIRLQFAISAPILSLFDSNFSIIRLQI